MLPISLAKLSRLLIGTAIAGCLLAAIAVYADYRAYLDAPLNIAEQGATLEVSKGDSLRVIADRLTRQGLLQRPWYLRLYARISRQARQIKTGEYRLEAGLTPRALLAKLVAGDVIQYSLTIVEGWTFQQMLDAVRSHERLEHGLANLEPAAIMAQLGHPDMHPEGRFFPDTYHFPAGTKDIDFLRRAFTIMEQRLAAAWEQRAEDLPLASPYEALILASIVEKESAVAEERPEIAGVFIRRLRKGMLLQTDPTVIYGMGERYDGNIRRADLDTDTPYNTYTRKGLPPTPIALPGAGALAAAVNPAAGDSLYFVARGDGSHEFSKTLKEHNRAVRKYQLTR